MYWHAIVYVLIHHIIFWRDPTSLHPLFLSTSLVLTFSIDVVFILSIKRYLLLFGHFVNIGSARKMSPSGHMESVSRRPLDTISHQEKTHSYLDSDSDISLKWLHGTMYRLILIDTITQMLLLCLDIWSFRTSEKNMYCANPFNTTVFPKMKQSNSSSGSRLKATLYHMIYLHVCP